MGLCVAYNLPLPATHPPCLFPSSFGQEST